MSTEYKTKTDLIDLYGVLGLTIDVCSDPDCSEKLYSAYLKQSKKFHPDKNQTEGAEEMFMLIQRSYNILKDVKQRTNYNHKLKIDRQSSSSFGALRKAADVSDTGYTDPTPEQIESFEEQVRLQNKKYNFDPEEAKKPIPKKEAKKSLKQRIAERDAQTIELKPEKLFDGNAFDARRFNEAFDLAKKQNGGSDLMLAPEIPEAWNGAGTVANFSSFDNLDNLFVEDGTRYDTSKQTYSGIDFGPVPSNKITAEFVAGLNGADYYDQHNVLGDDYYEEMKRNLAKRQTDQSSFEKMGYGDYDKGNFSGYGIHDQLGFQFDDRLTLDLDDDDISVRFDKLMLERQKELVNPPNKPNRTKK
jgi:curved DNA-binding protein CbpA